MRSRRALVALVAVSALAMAFLAAPPVAYDGEPAFVTNPVGHVDTLIGTGTGGEAVGEINNFPGASMPFGMVQYSPDTVDTYAGYNHARSRSTGFSMTHASVGCPAFGDISMLPTTTPVTSQPWTSWERIAHDDSEVGVPGYYSVRFPGTGVTAELTATTRTGVGRFRYPHDRRPALFHVRSGASLAGNSAATFRIEDDTTITGSASSTGFCGKQSNYTVYFAMKFDQPFTAYGAWDGYMVYPGARAVDSAYSGGYVSFAPGAVLEVRTAISYVSVDGARANLAAEGTASFGDVRAAAAAEWNSALARIVVAGHDGDNLTTFYTSLYRTLLHPNTFNDADGRYIGFDGIVHTVSPGHTQYANFSDWDTYRGLAALHGLLFPKQGSDMAQSLVNDAVESGSYPRWPIANSATGEMTGDSVVPLIVNLYAYGARDFDVKTALRYMVSAANYGGVGRDGYAERPGIATYLELGYAPQTAEFTTDHWIAGASITLEWAVDDFAISRFAESLGDAATAAEFQYRAQYWQNLFNPTTGYISPRGPDGLFPDGPGFVVYPSNFGQVGFDEGNAEQYVWWVPHNVAGLVTALGGRQAAAARLDRFTKRLNVGPNEPYLWIGNEPNFGVPWLYNYIGQPWRTQQTVERVRSQLFSATPDGEPGNDDLGAMSSWYVWAALGLYPSIPAAGILTLNTPLFDRAVITLPAGESIRISAPRASGRNRLKYIDGLRIDGRASDRTYLPESILRTGGELAFALSGEPNKVWGTAESSAPPSFGAGGTALTVNVPYPIVRMASGSTQTVSVDVQRMIDAGGDYTVTGAAYSPGITAASVSGSFPDNGFVRANVAITAAPSVPDGTYPVYLTARFGPSARTFVVAAVVVVSEEDAE
jgi:predicted alpha-1,2-mannosidase